MAIKWFHSLRFKLFLYMVIFLVLVTIGLGSNTALDFQRILRDQLSERSLSIAETAMHTFLKQTESWQGRLAQLQHLSIKIDKQSLQENLNTLLATDPDIISVRIVKTSKGGKKKRNELGSAFTPNTSSSEFNGSNPENIKAALFKSQNKWMKRWKKKKPTFPIYLENPSKQVGRPILNIWVPALLGKSTVSWAVIAVWQSAVSGMLPKNSDTESMLIDAKGRILVSPIVDDALSRKSLKNQKIVRMAISGKGTIGTLTNENSEKDKSIGTYYWSKRLRSGIIVQRYPQRAYTAITKQILKTGLLSLAIFLVVLYGSYFASRSITKSFQKLVEGTKKISTGNFPHRLALKSRDEVGFLGYAVNDMSAKIESLLQERVEAARLENEIDTARTVQDTFFPKEDRRIESFSVTGSYFPASECGGDWWGNHTTSDGLEFICVADATGHGAPAALVTAMAYSSCMTMVRLFAGEGLVGSSPSKLLECLNSVMYSAGLGKTSMTFFAAFIDHKTGVMTYSNAGHNFPYLIPANSDDDRLPKSMGKKPKPRSITIRSGGMPLGYVADSQYKDSKKTLRPGDKLFLYTDGLIECTNSSNEMWGKHALTKKIANLADKKIDEIKAETIASALLHFVEEPLNDDVTIVVAEMSKNWQPRLKSQEVA